MAKHFSHLTLVKNGEQSPAQRQGRGVQQFEIAALSELSSPHQRRVEKAVTEISQSAAVIGVQVTPRSWDLRPVIAVAAESRPSLIRYLGPEVTLSNKLTARVHELFERLTHGQGLSESTRVLEWGTFEGQLFYRRSVVDKTLQGLLDKEEEISLSDALLIARNLLHEIEVLHSYGVVHGHICPANISIADSGDLALIDVGIGIAVVQASRSLGLEVFPPGYIQASFAPETLESDGLFVSSDIYGLGMVLKELFLTIFEKQTAQAPSHNGLQVLAESFEAMCDPDPAKRPSLHEIRELIGENRSTRMRSDGVGPAAHDAAEASHATSREPNRDQGVEREKKLVKIRKKDPTRGFASGSDTIATDLVEEVRKQVADIPPEPQRGLMDAPADQPAVNAINGIASPQASTQGVPSPAASVHQEQAQPIPPMDYAQPAQHPVPPMPAPSAAAQPQIHPGMHAAHSAPQISPPVAPPVSPPHTPPHTSPYALSGPSPMASPVPPMTAAPHYSAQPPMAGGSAFPAGNYVAQPAPAPMPNYGQAMAPAPQPVPPVAGPAAQAIPVPPLEAPQSSPQPKTHPIPPAHENVDLNLSTPGTLDTNLGMEFEPAPSSSLSNAVFAGLMMVIGLFFFGVYWWQSTDETVIYSHAELEQFWMSGRPTMMIPVALQAIDADDPDPFAENLIVSSALRGEELPGSVEDSLIRIAFDSRWESELRPEDRRFALTFALAELLKDRTPKDLPELDTVHPGVLLGITALAGKDFTPILSAVPAAILAELPPPLGMAFTELLRNNKKLFCGDEGVRGLARFASLGVYGSEPLVEYLSRDTITRVRAISLLFSHDERGAQRVLDILLNHPNIVIEHPLIEWAQAFELLSWDELDSSDKLLVLGGFPPSTAIEAENVGKLVAHPVGSLRGLALKKSLEEIRFQHPAAFPVLTALSEDPDLLTAHQTVQLAKFLENPHKSRSQDVQKWLASGVPVKLAEMLLLATSGKQKATSLDIDLSLFLRQNGWNPSVPQLEKLIRHPVGHARLFAYTQLFEMHEKKTALRLLEQAAAHETNENYSKQLRFMLSSLKR